MPLTNPASSAPSTPIVGAHNFTEQSLRNFRAAMAQSDISLVNILLNGDSVTGIADPQGWGRHFEMLVSANIQSPVGRPENVRLGTNLWSAPSIAALSDNCGPSTVGGYWTTTTLSYGPVVGDRLKVKWGRKPSSTFDVVTVKCDGSTVGTFNCNGTIGIVEATYAAPAQGSHTWTFEPTSAKYGLICTAQSLSGAFTTGVQVYNFGYPGHFMDVAVTNADAISSLYGTDYYAGALSILTPAGFTTSGDAAQVATWKGYLQTWITARKASNCDVLLVMPCVKSVSGTATPTDYQAALIDIANTNNCPYIDFLERWNGWTNANALGYMADEVHPSADGKGGEEMARTIYCALQLPVPRRAAVQRDTSASVGVAATDALRPGVAATGSRPAATLVGAGAMFYDSTLGKPIWSDGALWRDAAGTSV